MSQRRHMQLHQLRRRNAQEAEVAHLEELAIRLEKRQRGGWRDAWDEFTEGVKDVFSPPPRTPKEKTENERPTSPSQPQGGRAQVASTQQSTTSGSTPSSTSRSVVTKTEEQTKGTPLMIAPSETKASEASPTSETSSTSDDPSKATMPPSIGAPTATPATGTDAPLAVAKNTPTLPQSIATPTPTSAASQANESGSAASKAGIAFGIIGGLLVISLIIFFLFKKRKQQMERRHLQEEDEKFAGAFAAMPNSTARRSSRLNAPRLSLRPSTAFDTNLNRQPTLPTNLNGTPAIYPKNSGSTWERPRTGNSANNPANPFGNHAERMDGAPAAVSHDESVGVGMLTRKQSIRNNAPQPLDLTLPPAPGSAGLPVSPAGTEYSVHELSPGVTAAVSAGAAAIAAAGGPAQSAVHRVQLDFKPTMEDEMELKAGSLVRLLFEYDDGWALCIRLDRSQQGVVPRTCLSTRPLKPRTGPSPSQRPGPPVHGFRQASPPVSMQTQGYSSPSPVSAQQLSPTKSGPLPQPPLAQPTNDPAGNSRGHQQPIERKPVPGQAI